MLSFRSWLENINPDNLVYLEGNVTFIFMPDKGLFFTGERKDNHYTLMRKMGYTDTFMFRERVKHYWLFGRYLPPSPGHPDGVVSFWDWDRTSPETMSECLREIVKKLKASPQTRVYARGIEHGTIGGILKLGAKHDYSKSPGWELARLAHTATGDEKRILRKAGGLTPPSPKINHWKEKLMQLGYNPFD